jgi:hydroxymethylpyrimidine pyrophosphatase-like HAD family hydrolase
VASVVQTFERLPTELEFKAIIGAMGTEVYYGGSVREDWSRRFGTWDRTPVDQVMASLGFEAHDAEFQTPLKASFEIPGREAQQKATDRLAALGQRCKIVVSGTGSFDVLPPAADKGDATLYVAELLGYGLDQLVVAGDSANDLAMFAVSPRGIVVGNARPELRDRVDSHRVFFAESSHARGILEGLNHYAATAGKEEVSQ